MTERSVTDIMGEFYAGRGVTVARMRAALAQLKDDDKLEKLAVTGNLAIVRDGVQVGYVDLLNGVVEFFSL